MKTKLNSLIRLALVATGIAACAADAQAAGEQTAIATATITVGGSQTVESFSSVKELFDRLNKLSAADSAAIKLVGDMLPGSTSGVTEFLLDANGPTVTVDLAGKSIIGASEDTEFEDYVIYAGSPMTIIDTVGGGQIKIASDAQGTYHGAIYAEYALVTIGNGSTDKGVTVLYKCEVSEKQGSDLNVVKGSFEDEDSESFYLASYVDENSKAKYDAKSDFWVVKPPAPPVPVTYLDEDGKEQTTNAYVVEASDSRVTWDAGWYVVTNEVALSKGADCTNAVHLILADTGKLTISGVEKNKAGIAVPVYVTAQTNSLAIYGQRSGTGELTVTGGSDAAGIGGNGGGRGVTGRFITINGGRVTATGGTSATGSQSQGGAGIGGGTGGNGMTITINGGTVTATGARGGAGVGGGNTGRGQTIRINGGTVTATGGNDYARGVGAGDAGGAMDIKALGYVIVKAGMEPNPTTEIAHDDTTDLINVYGFAKRYVTTELLPTEEIASAPTEVANATAEVFTNGVLSADGTVWSNRTAKVVYTAKAGYCFEDGTTAVTNKLDTTRNPAINKQGETVPVAHWNQRKPDYTEAKDWLLNHVLKPDEAKTVAGEPADDPGVDLVYIYGTVAMTNAYSTVDGFADLDDPQMRGDETTHTGGAWGMIPGSVKAFSDYTRVYMPFYRQMTLCGATNTMAGAGMDGANQAFADALQKGVAYEDVAAALDAYFANWNEGRPFILAGCSQGAAMLRNMIQYYFTKSANKSKLDRLVACYGIAYGVTKKWAADIESQTGDKIHFATNATERGVYISWNTVGPDSANIPNGLVPPEAISVNPLTWTTDATPADVDKNYGALTNAATGAVVAHLYDATVDTVNGVVVSTNLPASDYVKGLEWFGDKSLHTWEMSAWWENIRDNAYARIETATGKRPRCGTPNDYSKAENWMKKPETADKAVDVFFLYPTTDGGRSSGLIAEIDDAMKATAWDAYQQNTMGFWSYANMYAPYYRQASMLGLQAQSGVSGLKNFCSTHVVKTDVFAALDYYFTKLNVNAKRPYILVGHSQGSCNIKLVFEEYLKQDETHREYKDKLVAAYAMGFAVEQSWCKKAGAQFAEEESDTGVILTWNSEGPDATHGSTNFLTEPDDGQAINPLNWKTDDTYAGIELNLGSVVKNAKGEYEWGKGNADAQLSPETESAYGFRPGALVVTNTTAAYSPEVLGYQSHHGNDGAFFQRNVGNNGFKRYTAFASLMPVVTNDVPQVANATWEMKVKGEGGQWTAPSVSPQDGQYYAPAAAQEVQLVYTLDVSKAAEGYRFAGGEPVVSFSAEQSGDNWVFDAESIAAGTKVGLPVVQLGVVAQRYPWNGTLDIQYRLQYAPTGTAATLKVTANGVEKTSDVTLSNGANTLNFDAKKAFGEITAKGVKVALTLK